MQDSPSQANAQSAHTAWYAADRASFLTSDRDAIVSTLASAATAQGWHVEAQQHQEWLASVGILQDEISPGSATEIEILQAALQESGLSEYADVILEFDFRRRGLRMDCILLAPGIIAVLEFKRSKLTPADADQVTNYCINLVEFHEETRRLCEEHNVIVVPLLVQTSGHYDGAASASADFHQSPWASILRDPIRCDRAGLGQALLQLLTIRSSRTQPLRSTWLESRFSPSSTILDAAISLFGDHDVSAIHEHAGSVEQIAATVAEVAKHIHEARAQKRNRVIFVSGAPGAGKTLVGLQLAFDKRFREDAVFVTGNAPLVDVLNEALKSSYKKRSARSTGLISGYPSESARTVIDAALFKIVKAHNFLGERGTDTGSADGSIVIFDEAQRTYEKGRTVLSKPLPDHEADLVMAALEYSYSAGAVVVALNRPQASHQSRRARRHRLARGRRAPRLGLLHLRSDSRARRTR